MSDITRSESIKQLHRLKADIIHELAFVSKTKDKHPALDSLDMAIKSLETDEAYQLEYERTTKNDLVVDLIPREKVMQILQEHWLSGTVAHRIIAEIGNDIQCLPSASQEPRWIPVTEKLPHDRDWYLGIFKEPDTGWINPLPYICDYVGRETKATTKEHWILRGFTDWDDYHIDYYFNLECVAWMSLPQTYSEVEK